MFQTEGTAYTKQSGVVQLGALEEQKGETRGGGCVEVKVSKLGRGQGMQRGLGFYSESSGKPLKGFKQGTVKI